MSRAPLPPSAARSLGSLASTSFTTLTAALLLFLPACYEGPDPVEGDAWEGDEDDADDDDAAPDDDDGGDSAASAGSSAGDSSDSAGDSDDSAGDSDDSAGDSDDSAGDSDDSAGDSDDSAGETDGDDSGGPPPSDEVPDNEYCAPVGNWDGQWLALENEILEIVNEFRSQGANCGSAGSFGPAGPLQMAPALRCAARVHSKDMADRNFFDHTNPSGESPFDRMGFAGYSFTTAGENIAAGNSTAADTMDQWMGSDGHCSNIMNPSYTEIGVGYSTGGQYGHLWTQVFGTPQ